MFDVSVTSRLHITANSVEEAIVKIKGYTGLLPMKTSKFATIECTGFNGDEFEYFEPTCAHCNEFIRLIDGEWRSEEEEHPELCSGQDKPGSPHDPWQHYTCQNCGEDGREDDFTPSDDRPVEFCCPHCESVDVFPDKSVPLKKPTRKKAKAKR